MDRPPALSRRGFVRLGAAAAALAPLGGVAPGARAAAQGSPGNDPWRGLKLGIASYTFSQYPQDVAIQGIRRVDLKYVSIKESHLPLKSSVEERKASSQKFRDAGITPLSCGVITLPDDEPAIRNAFEYARDAGIPVIVCSPKRESLATLDRLVKEFDLRLAIHNHGPEDKVWPSPYDVWDAVGRLDERIGLCIDVGHTARCGVDPAESLRKCSARLYDVHLKDLATTEGMKSRPVEFGRGVLDLRGMLRALLDLDYRHHVGLEYEKDMKDVLPGVAESVGYLRGVMAGMS